MFRNYIKIAWRNILWNKLYSTINIGGLALGLTICMLIMLYVAHERSFDRFHANADRIFSISQKSEFGGDTINLQSMAYNMAPEAAKNDERIAAYLRLLTPFNTTIVISNAEKGVKFSEKEVLYADANFFSFFSFQLLNGNAKAVLNQPFSVVISEKMRQKYFGSENPIGKTLKIKADSSYVFQVSGVMKDMPSNTDINAEFIIPVSGMRAMQENAGIKDGGNFKTYFLLKDANHVADAQRIIQLSADKNAAGPQGKYLLTSLPDQHLSLNFNDSSAGKYLKIFPIVAALVLLLALVNYMSLSTARATLRAKEIGVRKVTGASRKIIAAQFYVESALYTILAFALAYVLYTLFHDSFLTVLQIQIDDSFVNGTQVLAFMTILLLLTIAVAGSYPSIVLSAFKPVATLGGKMDAKSGGGKVRKIFTTLQFTISVVLIICGIIIYNQLYFIRHTDTGVNRENVLTIPIQKTMGTNYQAFREEIQNLAGVKQVAMARYSMYQGYDMFASTGEGKTEPVVLKMLTVDQNFIPLMGIKWEIPPVLASSVTQPKTIVLNESLRDELKLPANPLGQKIGTGGDDKVEVVGVVKDFNFQSLSSKIDGLGIFAAPDTSAYWTAFGSTLYVKINPNTNLPTIISKLKNSYGRFDKENAFEYQFVDDAFNAMFKAEERLAGLFGLFMGLTLLIAMMGLYGLSTFTAQQRTKEIGIRKVLGATVTQITTLLSKDFLLLVLIAIMIASPIAWYAMNQWLQDFAYRITIEWWVFALAGIMALLIAFLTISYQAIKAALANPVKSLRTE